MLFRSGVSTRESVHHINGRPTVSTLCEDHVLYNGRASSRSTLDLFTARVIRHHDPGLCINSFSPIPRGCYFVTCMLSIL